MAHKMDKANVIILVIDSKTTASIISQEKETNQSFLKKEHTSFSTLDVINIVTNSVKNTIKIEKSIDDILWKLGFVSYFKGTIYLKDAILLAYNDKKLLQDMNNIVKKVAKKNNVKNYKLVRSAMDKSLNSILNSIDDSNLYRNKKTTLLQMRQSSFIIIRNEFLLIFLLIILIQLVRKSYSI